MGQRAIRARAMLSVALLANAVAALGAVNVEVVCQLGSPLQINKVKAVYGPAGVKYQPSFYADVNPEKKDRLWLNASFVNNGADPVTQFTFDVVVFDSTGAKIWQTQETYDQPVRDKPVGKEWGWDVEGFNESFLVVVIPRVLTLPGGRKWETDERFIKTKLEEKGLTP